MDTSTVAHTGQSPAPVKDAELIPEGGAPAHESPHVALAVRRSDAAVQLRDPAVILRETKAAAEQLTAYMAAKKDIIQFNGERYIEQDDWQAVAAFYGCHAQLESDRYVEYGQALGFEATYILVARDGRVLGRETSMCLNDEENWSRRPSYVREIQLKDGTWVNEDDGTATARRQDWKWEKKPEWPKARPVSRRVKGPDVPVPLFQLRSMAHTRARSRVISSIFGFVPTWLGIKQSPAEELPSAKRYPKDGSQPRTAWENQPEPPEDLAEIDREIAEQDAKREEKAPAKPKATKEPKPKPETAAKPEPAKPQPGTVYKGEPDAPARPDDTGQGLTAEIPEGAVLLLEVLPPEAVESGDKMHTRWPITYRTHAGASITAYIWHDERVMRQAVDLVGELAVVEVIARNSGKRLDVATLTPFKA